ncbi:MAG: hypothetical protein ACOX5R_14010 [bacterium]|jgi:hypothetical protein
MAGKPSKQDILENYSFREILDILEQKAAHDAQKVVNSIRDNLPTVFRNPGGGGNVPSERRAESAELEREGRYARPAGGAREGSLSSLILEILDDEPKRIEEILADVQKLGWSTRSSNPKSLVTQQLVALTKKGNVRKAGRGLYVKG